MRDMVLDDCAVFLCMLFVLFGCVIDSTLRRIANALDRMAKGDK